VFYQDQSLSLSLSSTHSCKRGRKDLILEGGQTERQTLDWREGREIDRRDRDTHWRECVSGGREIR